MNLREIAISLDLTVSENMPGDVVITGVSIDTRTLEAGNLFVALRGTRVDGQQFIPEAIKRGASAVLCSELSPECNIPQLVYPDLEKALGLIATAYRASLSCPVVALTGSNGKTTVKEMLASILPKPAFATPGNWNNHLGVPLSIMKLNKTHRYAVLELGANHAGEIAYTSAMAKPHVTLINNISGAHIEGFGSIEGIAKAKGEIHQNLLPGGTAVINADDDYAHYWDDVLANKKILRFSATQHDVDIYAKDIELNHTDGPRFKLVTPAGDMTIILKVPGMHHVLNALAAASCAYALHIALDKIAEGLAQFSGVPGRLTSRAGRHDAMILDDTYNANLSSVLAGIHVLAARKGKRVLVLGDMGELGEHSAAYHQEAGEVARTEGLDKVFTCGTQSHRAADAFGEQGQHFETQEALLEALLSLLDATTTVLVKGSRSSAMENVVNGLVI
ncbi:MAG: UDP-N-acetylmuramoyl-tripeptide--D-alanyl-D-alanine ligase [Legionellaceae bacterium]|nr:UDP-N-acetylmuramoyl-tripeptide--D-alanyl-D-alanine ligase [Legionellaceae bacterium]